MTTVKNGKKTLTIYFWRKCHMLRWYHERVLSMYMGHRRHCTVEQGMYPHPWRSQSENAVYLSAKPCWRRDL